jgi:hypothetical protein
MEKLKKELGWGDKEESVILEIFNQYSEKISNGEKISWAAFEHELRDRLTIGYQIVKQIVLSFYRKTEYVDVCKGYAAQHDVLEFKEINKKP